MLKIIQAALLLAVTAMFAATATAQEVGDYPTAQSPLQGNERMLADQAGATVNITPAQIESFLFPGSTLPVLLGGTGAHNLSGVLRGNGTSAVSSASSADVYNLWTSPSSACYLRGDGVCASPAGAGTVTTTGTPSTGGIVAFSGLTAITNATFSNLVGLFTGTCNSGTFLRADGVCATVSGSGTVTSIGITLPGWYTVSPASITSSGTFAITPTAGQSPNLFLATPTSAPGSLGLRAITNVDLPLINLASGVTNKLAVPNGGTGAATLTGIVKGNGTGPFSVASAIDITGLWGGSCNSTSYLRGDGLCAVPPGGGGSGTISSITMTVPSWLSVSPATLTTNGTFAITQPLPLPGTNGGTGVNNGSNAITLANNLSTTGNFPLILNSTASTTATLPAGVVSVGYMGLPRVGGATITSGTHTAVLAEIGQRALFNCTVACTYAIPANSTTAFPIDTTVLVVQNSCQATTNLTITIATDSLFLLPGALGGAGVSRTLGPCGLATIFKETATVDDVMGQNIS